MPDSKLSAREAALIAQARAELVKAPAPAKDAQASAQVARVKRTLPATAFESAAAEDTETASPARALDPAERIAALMAAARAEAEQLRQRQRRLYVWAPLAFMCVVGLWTLLWLWRKL